MYAGFEGAVLGNAVNALWDKYRYRMINNCNRGLWMDYLGDKARSLYRKYNVLFEMFEDIDFTDEAAAAFENEGTTESEDYPDTPLQADDKYLSGKTSARSKGKSYTGTAIDTYRADLDRHENPYNRFADEFESLFLNRW